ncbi:MAG: sulfite exporter TauE/SafE family protein [Lentisphaeria bacterium]|nr:sulfite exporter TauE/SafE family protein [Lentisphaeria bacterium]
MSELEIIALAALVVFSCHLLEGVTGFGSTVVSLPFLAALMGIRTAVPLLCVMSWVMAIYIVLRSWRAIAWREYGFICFWVALGVPAGLFLFDRMPAEWLCVLLGIFMIGVGIQGSVRCWKPQTVHAPPVRKRNGLMKLILWGGGVVTGAFGTGGPFVVIYASGALQEKTLFRVTLSLLWLTMGTWRLLVWTWQGDVWTPELLRRIFWMLPFLVLGVLLGDFLHYRVKELTFRKVVYGVLSISGTVMLGSNLLKILQK